MRGVPQRYGGLWRGGFHGGHLEAFRRHGIERVLVAYDRDEAGDRAAEKLAPKLIEEGFECFSARVPEGHGCQRLRAESAPAAKALGVLIGTAEALGGGPPSHGKRLKRASYRTCWPTEALGVPEPVLSLAAAPVKPPPVEALPEPEPKVSVPEPELAHEIQGQDLLLTLEGRRYRVRGWDKPLNPELLTYPPCFDVRLGLFNG